MTKSVKVICIIIILLGVLIVGMFLYFKYFVTPVDKNGMVYQNTEQTSREINPEKQDQNDE